MTNYQDWNKGDRVVLNDSRYGTLLTKPVYIAKSSSGLFYADIEWDDGEISRGFMVCLLGLKNLSKDCGGLAG